MIRRVLVVRPDALGDMVFTLPLIATLENIYPESDVYVLAQAYTEKLLEGNRSVKAVLRAPVGVINFFRTYKKIRSLNFDVVMFPYLDWTYSILMFLTRIPVRVGDLAQKGPSLFLTHGVSVPVGHIGCHEVEQNVALCRALGYKDQQITNLQLEINAKDQTQLELAFVKFGKNKKVPYVMIHPTIGAGNRPWKIDRYAQLIDGIPSNFDVVISGTQTDKDVAQSIIGLSKSPRIYNLCGSLDLGGLKALLNGASCVVGGQTGPVHLASLFKVPVVSLSTTKFIKAGRWGPWRTKQYIVTRKKHCSRICKPYAKPCEQVCSDQVMLEDVLEAVKCSLDGASKIQPEDEKAYRFLKSGSIGLFLSGDKIPDRFLSEIQCLNEVGASYFVFVSNHSLYSNLKQQQEMSSNLVWVKSNNLINWIKLTVQYDIIVYHVFEPISSLRYYGLRYLSAPWVYSSPVVCFFKDNPTSNGKDLIGRYIAEYDRLFYGGK